MEATRRTLTMPASDAMLDRLIESAKAARGMTPAERHQQRRSWVIGELMLEHPEMTKAEAERLADTALGNV